MSADQILQRVRRSRDTWVLDRGRIEVAVHEHLAALAIDPFPIRWAEDAANGYTVVHDIGWSAILQAALSTPGFTKADLPKFWSAASEETTSSDWSTAWASARDLLMTEADAEAREAVEAAQSEDSARRVEEAERSELQACVVAAAAAGAATEEAGWSKAHRKALAKAGKKASWATLAGAHPRAAVSAAAEAAKAAAWGERRKASSSALDGILTITMPFVDAFEAGLFLFWVTKGQMILVPR